MGGYMLMGKKQNKEKNLYHKITMRIVCNDICVWQVVGTQLKKVLANILVLVNTKLQKRREEKERSLEFTLES